MILGHPFLAAFWQVPFPSDVPASQRRALDFSAGRRCAALCLESVGFSKDQALHRSVTTIDHQPHWPDGYHGSITHTVSGAAARLLATAHSSSVGRARELYLSRDPAHALKSRVMSEKESILLQDWNDGVVLAFSAKESLYKAAYPVWKKKFYFSDAEIQSLGPGQMNLKVRFEPSLNFSVFYERLDWGVQTLCFFPS